MELIELLGLPISAGDCFMVNAFWLLDTLVWAAEASEELRQAEAGFIQRAQVALTLDDDLGVNEVAAWHHRALGREFPVWLEDQILARLEHWDESEESKDRLVKSLRVSPSEYASRKVISLRQDEWDPTTDW